jgi:glycerol-1-phosphate dehydrogenase [NAD(P)+]
MTETTAIQIPTLLRIKPNTLYKLGKYLRRNDFNRIALFYGEGMQQMVGQVVEISLDSSEIKSRFVETVSNNDIESVVTSAFAMPRTTDAIVAVGGGMAIDYAKYAGFLARKPVIAVPTALSNDGFSSPGASLKVAGKRVSCPASIPFGVVLDTAVIAKCPPRFTHSGVGDLLSKYSAVFDWKLAYWETGEQVNDFAVLIALQSVENFVNHPNKSIGDLEFIKLMAGALVMSGVSMEVSGSSRPASGSEHLISHAYEKVAATPSMHGLQVGLASIGTMWLQEHPRLEDVVRVLAETGFLRFVKEHPLEKAAFIEAIRLAPTIKDQYYTILSPKSNVDKLVEFVSDSPVWDGLLV